MSILETAASAASREYVYALESAYRRWQEVYDQDYGLANDPNILQVLRRDPETAHVMNFRRRLAAGSRWRIVPASDDDKSGRELRAAAIVERLIGECSMFQASLQQLANAVFTGSAWACVEGRYVTMSLLGGQPRRWWVPTRLKNVDKRRFRQVVDENGKPAWELYSIKNHRYEPLGNRRAHFIRVVFEDDEESLGHGRGLVESIYHWQYAKAKVLAEGLGGVERWAQGIVKASVNGLRKGKAGSSNETIVQEWVRVLEKLYARHKLVHDKEDEVTVLPGPGQGHEMVKDFLAYLRDGIQVCVLGSNLPTRATSGGSYALAEVQENSTDSIIMGDQDVLSEGVDRGLVPLVWSMNAMPLRAEGVYGAVRPRFTIASRMRRDPASAGTMIGNLLNAGVRGFRQDEVFDMFGLTPAGPHDKELEVAQPAGAAPLARDPNAPDPSDLHASAAYWKARNAAEDARLQATADGLALLADPAAAWAATPPEARAVALRAARRAVSASGPAER